MVLAQAILEYGVVSKLMTSAEDGFIRLSDSLVGVDASTWIVVASGVFLLWLVLGRPR